MKKIVTVVIAFLTVFSVFSEDDTIAKDMLGTPQKFGTWGKHQKAKFTPNGGPDGKSFVTITVTDPKKSFSLSRFLPVDKLKGRKIVLYGKVKADNVKKVPEHWLGIKFLIVYQLEGKKGNVFIEGKFPRSGSFDWKEFETAVKLPNNISLFCINIGIQGTTGTVHVSDVDLKYDE